MAPESLLWFMVNMMIAFTIGYGNPHVVIPSGTTAMLGDDVTLPCTVRKNSSEVIKWTIGINVISSGSTISQSTLSPTQLGRFSITGNHDIGEYNLHIVDMQAEDAGEYSCGYFSVSDRRAYFSPIAIVTVIEPPSCDYYPLNVELVPGSQIQMICSSRNNRPNTEVTWFRNGQPLQGILKHAPVISRTVSPVLTEDDYDQPFTCVENLSPISYAPHCSIIPLRRTQKPVHVVKTSEVVIVGDISHLTCLTDIQLSDQGLSYRWLIGSTVSLIKSNILSFGPVEASQNGTNITCEVFHNGEYYGNDTFTIEVLPSRDDIDIMGAYDGELPSSTSPTVNTKTQEKSRNTQKVMKITQPIFQGNPATGTPPSDYYVTANLMDSYLIIFIVVAATIGVLLVVAIVCLTLVLTRQREISPLSKRTSSCEEINNSSFAEFGQEDESAIFSESNIINECIEAGTARPHYFTLEADSKGTRRKERKVSDSAVVTYSKVSKNKKSSKRNSSPRMGHAGEPHSDIFRNRSTSAYAVRTVGKTTSKRHMSAKRPLPERPEGEKVYKDPPCSYSESGEDVTLKRLQANQSRDQDGTLTANDTPSSSKTIVVDDVEQTTASKIIPNLIIDSDYTEVGETSQHVILKCEERPYEFTAVYDALHDDQERKVLKCNPDSGYHDSSSTEGTEPEIESDGQRSASSLDSRHLFKLEGAEDNLYASLEDCSVVTE